MTSELERYLDADESGPRVAASLSAIISDAQDALGELPIWEKSLRIFWLLGAFILLF